MPALAVARHTGRVGNAGTIFPGATVCAAVSRTWWLPPTPKKSRENGIQHHAQRQLVMYKGRMMLPLDYWLARAADARAIADEMEDGDAKSVMLTIIAGYEQLAARAASIAKQPPSGPSYRSDRLNVYPDNWCHRLAGLPSAAANKFQPHDRWRCADCLILPADTERLPSGSISGTEPLAAKAARYRALFSGREL